MEEQQLVKFSPEIESNLTVFMWVRLASKVSYNPNITVNIVVRNTPGPEYISLVSVVTLVITSLSRVLLV